MSAALKLKIAVARLAGAVSRLSRRGGGTSLPGKLLLRLQPDAIARLSAELPDGCVVISATNGKTTTAALVAEMLEASGRRVVHNHAGANMAGGVATALLDDTRRGRLRAEIGVFEVDEAWVPEVVAQAAPRVILFANLFRDQLDRHGELESLAEGWQKLVETLPEATVVVTNADDPLLAEVGRERANTRHFGLEDTSQAEEQPRHAADSKFCRSCGAALVYSAVQLGHLGIYSCPNCDFTRPSPQTAATAIESRGMEGSRIALRTPAGELTAELPIPGLYNVYNAVAAAALGSALGLSAATIADGLESAKAVFGRTERLQIDGRDVALLLIKNPTGANEVLRTITAPSLPFDLWIALNDRIADGRDISWIWDVDFELLAAHVRNVTCAGTRAPEMALRLALAGVSRDAISCRAEIADSFDQALSRSSTPEAPLYALPTYTALLELRTEISRRGVAAEYWSER